MLFSPAKLLVYKGLSSSSLAPVSRSLILMSGGGDIGSSVRGQEAESEPGVTRESVVTVYPTRVTDSNKYHSA